MYPLRFNNMHFQFALDRDDGNEIAEYMTIVYCNALHRRSSIKIRRIYIFLNKRLTTSNFNVMYNVYVM